MKLLEKYNRINVLASVAIFLLASIAFYFLLQYVLISRIDDDLEIEEHEILLYASRYNRLPETMPVKDQLIVFEPAKNAGSKSYATVMLRQPAKGHAEKFRQLVFPLSVNNQLYTITVSKSLEGTEDITRSIVIISLSTILVMLISGAIINRLVLSKLWQPFYTSLHAFKQFRLGISAKPVFAKTGIDEFNFLNETLGDTITNAENEYRRLKEFTENASHELQTPLAVIRSKMDVLIQDEHLTDTQGQLVQGAYDAIEKLSRLNQSLLLLSKIENNQFADCINFNLTALLNQKLDDFKEIWEQKQFIFQVATEPVTLNINPALAEVLLNNLFSNATIHTPYQGRIEILLTPAELLFSNTAVNGPLDSEKLFQRFYKGGQPSDHHGLGLSIVQKICIASGMKAYYRYSNGMHSFAVKLQVAVSSI